MLECQASYTARMYDVVFPHECAAYADRKEHILLAAFSVRADALRALQQSAKLWENTLPSMRRTCPRVVSARPRDSRSFRGARRRKTQTLTGSRNTQHIAVVGLLDTIVDHQASHGYSLLALGTDYEGAPAIRVPAFWSPFDGRC